MSVTPQATTITPENAREEFMKAFVASGQFGNGETERKHLLQILQNKDPNVRDALATCVNEEVVIRAFVFASFKNDVDLRQALHDIGVDVNAKNQYGENALTIACSTGKEDSVRWLLDHKANVEIQNDQGCTPLMYACSYGKIEVVEMLLQQNANPNIQKKNGKTALMEASESCYRDIVQLLLNYNSDIDLKDDQGKTALDLTGDREIKDLLRNHVPSSYVLK